MKGWLSNGAVAGLLCLAAVQAGVLSISRGGPLAGAPEVQPGFGFAGVETLNREGRTVPLVDDRPTLVLVFHSECAHCQTVAGEWADWLEVPRSDFDVVAVTRESPATAASYADRHGWDVDVRSAVIRFGGTATSLTGRTPWVFGLSSSGAVVASGQGAELDAVADQLSAATQ